MNEVTEANASIAVGARRRVSIRPIEPSDAAALCGFYAELSPESRRRRFLGMSRGITPEQAQGFVAGQGVGAVLHEAGPADGAIVGHACMPLVEPGVAEVAFAVADRYQGRGIGRALLAAVITVARRLGVHRLVASMYGDNAAIHRLLLGTGRPYRWLPPEGGVDGLEIDLHTDPIGIVPGVPKGTSGVRQRPTQRGRSARSGRHGLAVR